MVGQESERHEFGAGHVRADLREENPSTGIVGVNVPITDSIGM